MFSIAVDFKKLAFLETFIRMFVILIARIAFLL